MLKLKRTDNDIIVVLAQTFRLNIIMIHMTSKIQAHICVFLKSTGIKSDRILIVSLTIYLYPQTIITSIHYYWTLIQIMKQNHSHTQYYSLTRVDIGQNAIRQWNCLQLWTSYKRQGNASGWMFQNLTSSFGCFSAQILQAENFTNLRVWIYTKQ